VIATWVGAQIVVAIAAALVVGASMARRTAAALLLVAAATVPWFAPAEILPRALLAVVPLACMKTIQIAATPGAWPLWRRPWHLCAPFDVCRTQSVKPALEWRMLGSVLLHGAIAGAALLVLAELKGLTGLLHAAARMLCAAVLIYALAESIAETVRLGHRIVGIKVPPIQRVPVLSRSAAEFWGERWNRPMSEWLYRFVFLPLVRRRHPTLGLVAAFGVTAAVHAWMAAAAGLGAQATMMMGAFFLVQGAAVLAETRLALPTWPVLAAHTWTVSVLLASSPLFLSSPLRVLRF
jgi:hypothetical protein